MTASERVVWEVGQWQASRNGRAPAALAPEAQPATAMLPAEPAPAMTAAATDVRERPRAGATKPADRDAVVHTLKKRAAKAQPAPLRREPGRAAPSAPPKAKMKPATEKETKATKAKAAPKKPQVLELRPGETIAGEVRGWTRLRRATLYVTNLRVGMVSFPGRLQWIPHENIDATTVRAAGKGLRFESTIEMISFETSRRKDIRAIHDLAARYGEAARRPGTRFDASLVQEWCDRSQEMWDSHTGQFRLWIRRHPIVTFASLGIFVAAAKLLGP